MMKLTVYDPAMCCDTGVCGVDADTVLITFASDIDWLQKNGVEVQRFNLAQEPAAFVENPVIKAEINQSGEACLPLLMLEDEVISRGVYPDRKQLQSWVGLDSLEQSPEAAGAQDEASSCCGPSSCCG
jgi:hypothetical protein